MATGVRKGGWLGLAATGVGATAAALAAGVVVERRVVRSRVSGASGADRLRGAPGGARSGRVGGRRGDPVTVRTDDGLALHAEVDEAAGVGTRQPEPTLMFVHGYALNLD